MGFLMFVCVDALPSSLHFSVMSAGKCHIRFPYQSRWLCLCNLLPMKEYLEFYTSHTPKIKVENFWASHCMTSKSTHRSHLHHVDKTIGPHQKSQISFEIKICQNYKSDKRSTLKKVKICCRQRKCFKVQGFVCGNFCGSKLFACWVNVFFFVISRFFF